MIGEKLRMLFLCTGNSCRSQMAECWVRRLKGDAIGPYSAGVDPGSFAARAPSADEALGHYRRVRDEIRAFVEQLPESLGIGANPGTGIAKEPTS